MRVFLILVAIVIGMFGLVATICGGMFTFAELTSQFGGSGDSGYFGGILGISLPVLLGGLAAIFGAYKLIRAADRMGRENRDPRELPPAGQVPAQPPDDRPPENPG